MATILYSILCVCIFLVAMFMIIIGVRLYLLRNNEEEQNKVNASPKLSLNPQKYSLNRVMVCISVFAISMGMLLLFAGIFGLILVIGEIPDIDTIVIFSSLGLISEVIFFALTLETWARKR